ncbi:MULTISPECIES: ABC transporter ATP-binding protein [Alphaproteobacteria]|uniref:Spermidine/putrescine import ATP-binding protein PotA n=2 Tax=Alphaproteobacteria TaxID=28211 RepID=A0A512HN19_9HYPH|nr:MULTISPECIES: ABC transporter ATP-binding protein [Alphaproteobacteria]GEO86847.1 polyamine-transporting ATPase [Ciceribacter naphthalenivorans]GLR23991.1 polyamine-transporting ATPase [Ciceribacter naphthalenivorans]GLT06847.1 polyamine-transporting ATPase [Sphingomonas psychrolutea]
MTHAGPSAGAAIDIWGASKFYGDFTALDDVSLRIQPGEFMSFLGPSGSGKTTTLNLIAGFTSLSAGNIRLDERSIGNLPAHKRNIGVVFQHYALFPHMTVAANVAYPLRQRNMSKAEREKRVHEALAKVKLETFADRYPSALSGGQQQRVALARAMVFAPPLLLMDEPLGALDKKLREVLQLEIKRIHRELGSTFVYVTHDQEEALVLSDRIAVFNKGRIEQVGTSEELYMHPKTLFVGQFIGESSVLRGPYRVINDATAMAIGDKDVVVAMMPETTGAHAILLRPDAVAVQRIGTGIVNDRTNILSGTVREKLYLGSSAKYEVALPNGMIVTSRMPPQGSAFDLGERVEIAWRPEDGILLADDGTQTASL